MKTLSLFLFFASISAFATTEVRVSGGSSTTIHAGEEVRVICEGGGHGGGGGRPRCECVVGHGTQDDRFLTACGDNWSYVLKKGNNPLKTDGCWREATSAAGVCEQALAAEAACR